MQGFDWQEFDLELFKLKNQKYNFTFELKQSFFAAFEQELIPGGDLKVHFELLKSERMIQGKVTIQGALTLTCDRTLQNFDLPIDFSEEVYYQYGEEEEELEPSVFVISRDRQVINLARLFFDLVAVQVPLKKLHPDLQESPEASETDEAGNPFLYQAGKTEDEQEKQPIDPRWEALKKLSNN